MKNFKNFHYLTEQDQSMPPIYERMRKLINILKGMSKDEKTKLAEDPDDYGGEFWEKTDVFLKDVNSYITNPDSVLADEDAIIKELQNELQKFPDLYDNNFKSTFDRISPVADVFDTPTEADTEADPDGLGMNNMPPTEGDDEVDTEADPDGLGMNNMPPTKEYVKSYTGYSIVDFLDQSGKPSDFASRKELATKMGIPEYRGTASQNLLMLNALRSGQKEIAVKPAEFSKAAQTSSPQIKFGGSNQTTYIDMGGGRYAPASEDQLGDPNVQLYVKNPKKGQGEYLKPNYVKVRREGEELRRQSKFGGVLGSLSNLAGDVGNTLAGKNREDQNTQRERQERVRPDENYPTADRPPAKKQSKENKGVYKRNSQDVEEFFK